MQSLLCKALEVFVLHIKGPSVWRSVLAQVDLPGEQLELFQRHKPEIINALNAATAEALQIDQDTLMEDLGTWVCTHPPLEPVRRLIRFSGETFEEMIYSLEELSARIDMAMPGLNVPIIEMEEDDRGQYRISVSSPVPGAGAFLLGVLRTMADDYGALALVELSNRACTAQGNLDEVSIQLLDEQFAAPRAFDLGGAA